MLEKVERKRKQANKLKRELHDALQKEQNREFQLKRLQCQLDQIQFPYASLNSFPDNFFYMAGQTVTEFDRYLIKHFNIP